MLRIRQKGGASPPKPLDTSKVLFDLSSVDMIPMETQGDSSVATRNGLAHISGRNGVFSIPLSSFHISQITPPPSAEDPLPSPLSLEDLARNIEDTLAEEKHHRFPTWSL